MAEAWALIESEDWAPAVRWEIAALKGADGVVVDSISVWRATSPADHFPGRFHIRFDLAAPGLTNPVIRFLEREPMILAWADEERLGCAAPVVFSGRPDFPPNLPHLNPVPDGWPASPCLSVAGLEAIYQRFGSKGVVDRLRQWLLDAAAGSLDADGWHPVPRPALPDGFNFVEVLMDPAIMQEFAARGEPGGFVAGVASGFPTLLYMQPADHPTAGKAGQQSVLAKACKERAERARATGSDINHIPWILLWSHAPTTEPVFGYAASMRQLLACLDVAGLGDAATKAITEIEVHGATGRRYASMDKALLLAVAVRRPLPLKAGMPGLSKDDVARSFELLAYLVEGPTDRTLAHMNNRVTPCVAKPWPNAALFRHVSGAPRFNGAAMIGAGALGSSLIDQLLRLGLDNLLVLDKDRIEPHNLPRHGARGADVGIGKAEWAEKLGAELGRSLRLGVQDLEGHQAEFWVRGQAADVTALTKDDLHQAFLTTPVLIDTTASVPVRNLLCGIALKHRIVRAEIFDRGRLGVLCVGAAGGNPDPFDLYYALCALFDRDEAVKAWLSGERSGSLGLEELVTGFGCASATVRLPKWAIDQHATAFLPTLTDVLRAEEPVIGGGIGLSPLNARLQPQGWRWCDVPTFNELLSDDCTWKVRIAPDVLQHIRELRAGALPHETGGYLFGGWDRGLKRITVVTATPAPPGSRSSPSDLDLLAAERCPKVRTLLRRSAGRLHLVGTWHSHPDGHPLPSPKDTLTISAMASANAVQGVPTLMLIQSDRADVTVAFSPGGGPP